MSLIPTLSESEPSAESESEPSAASVPRDLAISSAFQQQCPRSHRPCPPSIVPPGPLPSVVFSVDRNNNRRYICVFFLFILAHEKTLDVCKLCEPATRVYVVERILHLIIMLRRGEWYCQSSAEKTLEAHSHSTEPYYHTTCVEIWFEFSAFEASVLSTS